MSGYPVTDGVAYWAAVRPVGVPIVRGSHYGVRVDVPAGDAYEWGRVFTTRRAAELDAAAWDAAGTRGVRVALVVHAAGAPASHWLWAVGATAAGEPVEGAAVEPPAAAEGADIAPAGAGAGEPANAGEAGTEWPAVAYQRKDNTRGMGNVTRNERIQGARDALVCTCGHPNVSHGHGDEAGPAWPDGSRIGRGACGVDRDARNATTGWLGDPCPCRQFTPARWQLVPGENGPVAVQLVPGENGGLVVDHYADGMPAFRRAVDAEPDPAVRVARVEAAELAAIAGVALAVEAHNSGKHEGQPFAGCLACASDPAAELERVDQLWEYASNAARRGVGAHDHYRVAGWRRVDRALRTAIAEAAARVPGEDEAAVQLVPGEIGGPVLGYSGTGSPASSHAADPATIVDGFAPALCRSGLQVLVDHDGNLPVLAVADIADERPRRDGRPAAAAVGCNLCRAKLERMRGRL